jgi:hypothetical protein
MVVGTGRDGKETVSETLVYLNDLTQLQALQHYAE